MITSHFAVRKGKSKSTCRGNWSDFILEGGKLKRDHTSWVKVKLTLLVIKYETV